MIEAIVYLLAVIIAEVITVAVHPIWGVSFHFAVLVAVIVHSAITTRHPNRGLLLSLSLVPLVRIMSLSMPLANIPQIWWYPLIYVSLVAAAIMVMRILDLGRGQVGLTARRLPIQLVVALSGLAFGVVEYFILAPEPAVMELSWQEAWLPAVIFLLSTGFGEEFIFRGILQHTAVEMFRGWGIIYVSLLFAVLHIGFISSVRIITWIDVPFVFVVALFFAWVVKRTGSLLGVTLAHGITNIILYLVAPFLF